MKVLYLHIKTCLTQYQLPCYIFSVVLYIKTNYFIMQIINLIMVYELMSILSIFEVLH